MATTYETSSTAKSSGRDYDMSLWYDSRWYKFGLITMLAVAIFGSGISGPMRIRTAWTRWNRSLRKCGWDYGGST